MERIKCKGCGFGIVRVELWRVDMWLAQLAGYCCVGCQKVAEKIREIEAGRGKAA